MAMIEVACIFAFNAFQKPLIQVSRNYILLVNTKRQTSEEELCYDIYLDFYDFLRTMLGSICRITIFKDDPSVCERPLVPTKSNFLGSFSF